MHARVASGRLPRTHSRLLAHLLDPTDGADLSHQEQTHQGREVKQEDADLVGGHSTVMDRVKGLPRQAEPTGMQPIEPSSRIAAMPPQITTRLDVGA